MSVLTMKHDRKKRIEAKREQEKLALQESVQGEMLGHARSQKRMSGLPKELLNAEFHQLPPSRQVSMLEDYIDRLCKLRRDLEERYSDLPSIMNQLNAFDRRIEAAGQMLVNVDLEALEEKYTTKAGSHLAALNAAAEKAKELSAAAGGLVVKKAGNNKPFDVEGSIEILKVLLRPLAYKPKEELTKDDTEKLQRIMGQLKELEKLRDRELGNGVVKAAFDRQPTEEEELYASAANNLVNAFARGDKLLKPKPVRVRLMDIPKALKRDGQCSVALDDEYRIICTNRKGSPRQLQVFYHETWHAIDSVDPEHWANLCADGNEEWTAEKGAEHLAEIGKLARITAEKAAGRNQPKHFISIERETIEALARYSPAWLKEFQRRVWK